VEAVGQFSLRGGIIDFFPAHSQNPYRIELFDEEVDSIRSFDILTQRSLEIVDKVTVTPVEEILIVDKFKKQVILNLEKDLKKHEGNERIKEKFNKYMDQLEEGGSTNNQMVQAYIPDEFLTSIIDYISREALIFLDEPGRIREKAEDIQEDRRLKLTDLLEAGEVMISHFHMWYKYEELLGKLEKKLLIINSSLLRDPGDFSLKGIYNFTVKSTINYHNKLGLLTEDINHLLYRGYKVIILAGTKDRGLRLQKDLQDFNINSSFFEKRVGRIKSGQLFITIGSLKKGFEYVDNKLIVISDKEIFGAQKKKRGRSKKRKDQKVLNIADLNVGDYIVHENHGIGRYEGIEQLDIQGIKKDYLTIRYRDQDKLYIPIDQMNLIQKYVGSDAAKPRINRLNSGEWQRTKGRARKAVEDMAEDLLKLYAKRANLKGHAFSKDSPWQKQFEDLFPFEETEGQINSTLEIKKDMEKPKPMDRLLCGDVGYGKTEVALRAAFKALIDGKQVAILVPTTILAQQHYNTIIDRFGDFPVEVALLSRFRTAKEQKQTIEGLKNGTIDMVVGTHRLLSKDISFKDLGLLIIDEEQRFGVKHKEKLKKFRESIDVLTLTATPIPRTLHMSLVGIRDMSVIEEPPEERYPIQTYVLEYNPQMIRSAILKEIDRGGQVYFVYNRVETIEKM
ncbi:MAG TPA: DEAD/DEAH box helicase, partial [Tissierellaceae bacterium]|nr:DEAD/DEAH box helicase [Tissierellaceae bacterium]